jgi:membrane protein YdbS with pleckstrin-like domain
LSKTPIDRIQSVEVAKPDVWANLFNVGTVRVTTAAQEAIIFFDYVKNPEAIRDKLSELRQRVQELDAGRIQAELRNVVEGHFQKPEAMRQYDPTPPTVEVVVEQIEQEVEEEYDDRSWVGYIAGQFWQTLRRPTISFRTPPPPPSQQNVITYRRHWIVLLPRIWQPSLLNLALLAAIAYFIDQGITEIYALLSAVAFITGFWWVWRFEDWRNDQFQVTDRYVIDVNRRPFGFGESRTQAELGNIQNVNADRSGPIQWLLDYGTVYVETAGAYADITFENVRHPNDVQAAIFSRRDAFRRKQQVADSASRRREFAVMLDVYQQAQEQDRIPQRTPFREDSET